MSIFFLVEDLLMVVFFIVACFSAAVSFLVVAAVVDVVVIDSFLLAHDVNKPRAMMEVMEQINDRFISRVVVGER